MNYIELVCNINPYNPEISEIIMAILGDLGFESFEEQNEKLKAYIAENEFNEDNITEAVAGLFIESKVELAHKIIKQENWNETWEKNYFEPVVINDICVIRSSFHPDFRNIPYRITIDPKMSFGTGHHETTHLMISEILNLDLKDKNVLDMGCGTGILAILSSLRGAINVLAVDNDDWSYNNTIENIGLNHTKNVNAFHGDISTIKEKKFDIIYANINKNVLINDIPDYALSLYKDGMLLLSGFYINDFKDIDKIASENNLKLQKEEVYNNWMMLKYKKL